MNKFISFQIKFFGGGESQGSGASRNFISDGRVHPGWDLSEQESFFLQGSHPSPVG